MLRLSTLQPIIQLLIQRTPGKYARGPLRCPVYFESHYKVRFAFKIVC